LEDWLNLFKEGKSLFLAALSLMAKWQVTQFLGFRPSFLTDAMDVKNSKLHAAFVSAQTAFSR